MSSVFAIQIDVYPHHADTGEVNWPLRQAMGLLCAFPPRTPVPSHVPVVFVNSMLIQPPPVGISIAVILLIALIGLNINRISSYYTTRFGRASLWPVVAPSRHDDSDSDSDHTAKSIGSSRSSRSGK
jgi:hypothetical protein